MPSSCVLDADNPVPGIDPLLLTCTRIATFAGEAGLTSATGFFLLRNQHLFLVTSRHVFIDVDANHTPDRITIELHVNHADMAAAGTVSIPLYGAGLSLWRQATDSAGEVDVAVIELDQAALPKDAVYCAFTPEHIADAAFIEVGAALLVIGFPLGFHDALHHMPVVRRASLASSYGLRFQGMGYFLTDARTHRGTSGAPVVIRVPGATDRPGSVSCHLLGIHSSRFDMATRDPLEDEALGLNCAWYPDVLLTLTED
ncbi:MAG TPA: serine protease [Steroidobacteraceae bacterium]|nr:serine protease [Steroidobacteraceae bacterium]